MCFEMKNIFQEIISVSYIKRMPRLTRKNFNEYIFLCTEAMREHIL